MSTTASYNNTLQPNFNQTPQQFQSPIHVPSRSPSRSPQPRALQSQSQPQASYEMPQNHLPNQQVPLTLPYHQSQPIIQGQQHQQYQQQQQAQMGNSTTSSSNNKIQTNLNKVQAQLNTKGGKYGAWASAQLQTQADALKKISVVGDINSNGPPTLFHVFKAGGLFSKDDVVTGEDRNTPAYYLNFPRTYRNSWNLTLHHQSTNGPLVANLTKGAYGFTSNDIEISMSNGFKTILTKPSLISKNHQFIGLDGVTTYKWRKDGMLANTMTLQDLSTGEVVGTWQHSYSYNKDGTLLVSPKYNFMMDLIVASALAMEEWRREEESKPGAGGGSMGTMGLLKMGMGMAKKFKP